MQVRKKRIRSRQVRARFLYLQVTQFLERLEQSLRQCRQLILPEFPATSKNGEKLFNSQIMAYHSTLSPTEVML